MYIVEVIYGMESYQINKEYFEDINEAKEYYNEQLKGSPFKISLYQLIKQNSF